MKAMIHTRYGRPEVLHLAEVEKPAPKDNEVLIKILATSATKYDTWVRSSTAPPGFWLMSRIGSGIRKPKQPILGTDLAGEVEAAGKDVKRFKKGDQVYGFSANLGAYAEYICLPEEGAALKPSNLTYEEAAAVPYGALTALLFLRKANLQRGQKILIFGASGGVGSAAVQLARYFGAEVTGVCRTAKLEFVKALGADRVIDYTREDFTRNGQTYDVIFDTVGKISIPRSKKSLKNTGCYLFATFGVPTLVQMQWLSMRSNQKALIGLVEAKTEDLNFITKLIEAGEFRAVIDRCYRLDQMAEAHRYVESGDKKGNVIITVGEPDKTQREKNEHC